MRIRLGRGGRVDCSASVPLDLPAGSVWGQLRDFRRYASHDFFHHEVRVEGGVPRRGARLQLSHRFGCFRVERVGRILLWREGEGFAFSDLSRRGRGRGFPHVLILHVQPVGPTRSTLHLRVRGRWTAGWVPLLARRAWLSWVFACVVLRTRNELRAYEAAHRAARREAGCDALCGPQ